MTNKESKVLEELIHDLKEHNTSYAKSYEDECAKVICKLKQRENKLQKIEQMYKDGVVDLDKLYELITNDKEESE